MSPGYDWSRHSTPSLVRQVEHFHWEPVSSVTTKNKLDFLRLNYIKTKKTNARTRKLVWTRHTLYCISELAVWETTDLFPEDQNRFFRKWYGSDQLALQRVANRWFTLGGIFHHSIQIGPNYFLPSLINNGMSYLPFSSVDDVEVVRIL